MKRRNEAIIVCAFLAWVTGLATVSAWAGEPGCDSSARWSGATHWRDVLRRENGLADVTGAWTQIGGQGLSTPPDEFGGGSRENRDLNQGPSHLGKKVKAGLLSAVLPGAGQYYNGRHQKAYVMAGVEVAVWTAYFVFDTQGDNRMEDARDFAGIYAGTSGGHDDSYWQSVARYMDSDAYNEDRYREARALQEPVTGLISPQDAWQWANMDRLYGYRQMRADAGSAYDRRDFMILFAVVNRAVSVVDAVMGAGKDDPLLGADVLGMNIQVEVAPAWRSPAARCVISRGF